MRKIQPGACKSLQSHWPIPMVYVGKSIGQVSPIISFIFVDLLGSQMAGELVERGQRKRELLSFSSPESMSVEELLENMMHRKYT